MKKKRIQIASMLLLLLLVANSCTGVKRISIVLLSDTAMAEKTIEKIVEAVKEEDEERIVSLFSKTVRAEVTDLEAKCEAFLDFIEGDVLSHTSDFPSSTEMTEYGRYQYELNSAFDIETTEGVYHLAFSEYIIDDFQRKNEGVRSIYVIKDEDWGQPTVFRGGTGAEQWEKGVNIITEPYDPNVQPLTQEETAEGYSEFKEMLKEELFDDECVFIAEGNLFFVHQGTKEYYCEASEETQLDSLFEQAKKELLDLNQKEITVSGKRKLGRGEIYHIEVPPKEGQIFNEFDVLFCTSGRVEITLLDGFRNSREIQVFWYVDESMKNYVLTEYYRSET